MLGRPILLVLAISASLVACGDESDEDRPAGIRREVEAENVESKRVNDAYYALTRSRETCRYGVMRAIVAMDAEISRRSNDFWSWPAHSDAERARINAGLMHLRQVRDDITTIVFGP